MSGVRQRSRGRLGPLAGPGLLLLLPACLPPLEPPEILDNPAHDYDEDGFTEEQGDCADDDPSRAPDLPELCNGADDDCNGIVDDELDWTAWYRDVDGDGFGDESTEELHCTPPEGLVEVAGDCDDGDDKVFPGAEEACNEADDDCDDDVDEGLETWKAFEDADGDGYGSDAAVAVEVCETPPGYSERDDDCDDSNEWTYPGAPDSCADGVDSDCNGAVAPCTAPIEVKGTVITGLSENDYLGTDLALGDFDGDGQQDLLLGARGVDAPSGGNDEGAAYLVYGPVTGGPVDAAGAQTVALLGESAVIRAGFGVGSVDLDGDGLPEAVVGSPLRDDASGLDKAGGIYILPSGSRPAAGELLDEAVLIEGDDYRGYFGRGISGLGDVTGDGLDDLFVGAYRYVHPATDLESGAAWILPGGSLQSGTIVDLGVRVLGEGTDGYLGYQGAASGDVDGDGQDDLVTSAYRLSNADGDLLAGRAYLLQGPLSAQRDLEADQGAYLQSPNADGRLGLAMATGDMDGDGYAEVWLGAPGLDTPYDSAGKAYRIPGDATASAWTDGWVSDSADAFVYANEETANLGSALQLEDVDGDSVLDLVLGAEKWGAAESGAVMVFLGPLTGGQDDWSADMILDRSSGDGGTGEVVAVGRGLLPGALGPVLVAGAPSESELSEVGAGAVFLLDLGSP